MGRCRHNEGVINTDVNAQRPVLHWQEAGKPRSARWQSERGATPPARVVLADDTTSAATLHRLASEGSALLWRGDFHNARQLLQALVRRIDKAPHDKRPREKAAPASPADPAEAFHRHRLRQSQRARLLGSLLVMLDADHRIGLRRAPDLREACAHAWGPPQGDEPVVVSLRELLGVASAHEWYRKGVPVPALGERIHPAYGVFSPLRGEYVDLVARTPLPQALQADQIDQAAGSAFDIGTGSGVLAAVLARRGVGHVVATEIDPRALACARGNITRLGLAPAVQVLEADLFPPGRAALVVCNPPWLPARPSAPIERAVYDEGGRMLAGYLAGLAAHLTPGGEGWLVLSDLAEHLGLRTRAALLCAFAEAGLTVVDRVDTRPRHAKATEATDALHAARAAEVTSLWRLAAADRATRNAQGPADAGPLSA